jgi:hypothetical protein
MLLDDYLPAYDFNEVHSITAQAQPGRVYSAFKELTPSEISPLFRFLFAVRTLPERLSGGDERQFVDEKPLFEQLLDGGFVLLAEADGCEIVFGLIGQFWKLSGDPGIEVADAQEFFAFDHPDYARAVANFCMIEANGGTAISTETRIHIPDARARKKFALYWRLIYPGSALIRKMWLRAIKRRAERS